MLGTSNNIKNPGLRVLPPGVERYYVKGGGLSVIEVSTDDKIEIINQTELFVKKVLENAESGHDWFHIGRVRKNAKQIALQENADDFILELQKIANLDKVNHNFHHLL